MRMRVGTIWLDALAVRALTGLTLVEENTRTRSTEHPESQRIWCRFRVDPNGSGKIVMGLITSIHVNKDCVIIRALGVRIRCKFGATNTVQIRCNKFGANSVQIRYKFGAHGRCGFGANGLRCKFGAD